MPRWSPDGTRLMYASNLTGGGIRIIPAEGGDYVRLADGDGHLWSPDGAMVAVRQGIGSEKTLVVVDSVSGDVLAEVPGIDQSFPDNFHYSSWQRLAIEP